MTQDPVRTCIGCRAKRPKRELLRVAAINGAAAFDRKQRLTGRGFYLCRSVSCIEKGLKEKRLKKVTGAAAKGLSALKEILEMEAGT
jgi:hypothetical protein